MNLLKPKSFKRHIAFLSLLILYLLKCNVLFAQNNLADSSAIYKYWTSRGVIEVVYAYMNDYIITVTDPSLLKENRLNCDKEKQGLKEFEKQFITPLKEIEMDELSSKLDEVSSFLKNNNWPGAEKNVFKPLLANLRSKKALDNDFFSTNKPTGNELSIIIQGYSNKKNNWTTTVNRIILDYNEGLRQLEHPSTGGGPISEPPNPPTPPHSDGGIIKDLDGGQNWILVLIFCLLSFLTGIVITFFILKLRIYNLIGYNNEKYNTSIEHGLFSLLYMISFLKERKKHYKGKYEKLINKIEKIEQAAETKNDTTSQNSIENVKKEEIKDNRNESIEWDISKEVEKNATLYFDIPENDGRFINDEGEQSNDGSKIYKIVCLSNSAAGDLFYISGPHDKRAINRLDSYLKPVCDIQNISNAEGASKIEVIKNGKVIKIAGNWVIDTNHKVKIKLV